MNDHIDQLAQWWENAEDADASPGDHIIERHVCDRDEDTYYTVGVHREGMSGLIGKSGTRILRRAPRPKPAWHDAVAVIAHTRRDDRRRIFGSRPAPCGIVWVSNGFQHDSDVLIDPVPLIEAKVTAEMVDAAYAYAPSIFPTKATARRVLTAALGIVTE